MIGCPTCGNEGDCVEIWEDEDGKTHHAFYCETCSETYFPKIDSLRPKVTTEE